MTVQKILRLTAQDDNYTGGVTSRGLSRWCQYGYDGRRSLTASSFATCAESSFQSATDRFARSCSSVRAPITTLDTVGRLSTQLSAICGIVLPVSFAISSRTSMMLYM